MRRLPPQIRIAAALACAALFSRPCAAKTPEEFVGQPQAAQPAAKAAPARPADSAASAKRKPGTPAAPSTAPGGPSTAAQPSGKAAPSAVPAAAAQTAPAGAGGKAPPAAKTAGPKVAPAARPALDTAHIHAIYLDGDFEQALKILDAALKGRKNLTHADSVFIFKHMGVMYAATPATREKGRYYMLQLISIEPTAKILDMYASDMIYLIFRNVQEEFENKRGKAVALAPAPDTVAAAPPAAAKDSTPPPAPPPRSGGKNRTLYWAAGGVAMAAGTAGLLFILLDDPQPKKRNIVLDE